MFKRSVISMLMIALVYASVPAMAATKPATLAHKLNQVKALYLIGQTVAAFQEANQLVLAHPKNAKAWYVAAEAQAWQGHWKQANLDLTRAAGSARSHFLDVQCSTARIKVTRGTRHFARDALSSPLASTP